MDNTKKVFREVRADAMLVSSPDLRRYLTGFASSFGFVYVDAQESILFTDPRYAEGARTALKNSFVAVEVAQNEETVLDYIKSKKIKTIAVPLERLTLREYESLKKKKFRIADCMPALRKAMSVKSEEERQCIAKASQIAERAFLALLKELKEGMTESETAGLLEYLMRKNGAEDRSFETIAAFGKNTSVPHHAAGEDKLIKGLPVLLDFGCKWQGYCSDITRTFLFGESSDEEFKTVYQNVLNAHKIAAEGIHEGMSGKAADALARDYLKRFGLDKFFTHSLGHGVGVNIHEEPRLSPSADDVLQSGMVFSIEPGVYFEGKFGIRIEDTVCLSGGAVHSFMSTEKGLMVI